jgi:uncharacterized protein YbaP (TraB family)
VPDPRVLALPRSVRGALEKAEVLAPELSLDAGTQSVLATGISLPEGKTLSSVLPAGLYARLERFFSARGFELARLGTLKPIVLGAQLEVLDYAMSGRPPLDQELIRIATEAGKSIEALEKPEEQVVIFDVLTLEEQIEVLDEGLARLEKVAPGQPSAAEKMVRAYVAGDEKALWTESMAYVDPSDPTDAKFLEAIFTRRDVRFAERIDARLGTRPARRQLFAIGALHLFGPEGVIARLEKRGRTLVRLDGNAEP